MPVVRTAVTALAASLSLSPLALGQTVEPPFDSVYTLVDLGNPVGVPSPLGGLTLKANDANTLLIGGAANSPLGVIHAVPLERTEGRVTGFAGASTYFADAPHNDGGLAYGPGGVLFFTRYSLHQLGQILPGETTMHRTDSLAINGFTGSVGALQFVPAAYQSTGGVMALASYNSALWARADLSPAGDGSYDIASLTVGPNIGGGPEGIIYVTPGSPLFPNPSIIVCDYAGGKVVAYELDANGDPIVSTRRTFISGLSGAEGAYLEPTTGDFFFSTFGAGSRVVVVRGFSAAPCPGDVDGDGFIGFADLNAVLSAFNTFDGQPSYNAAADFDDDGDVDFGDLNVVLSAFNTDC